MYSVHCTPNHTEMHSMESWNRNLSALAAVVTAVVFILSAMSTRASAALMEQTFVVSQMRMTHLCRETLVTVVNGQLPGPTIEVTEGDSVILHVVNHSPHNMTIHWHGVKQQLNCWADGVPMITQCPILPNHNFTYRFDVAGQEGTLWWHAHVFSLRGTVHGAFIIRPRHGADSYPFPTPHREIPIVIGEWWEMDLEQMDRDFVHGFLDDQPTASTINGKLGDLFNCEGAVEDGYVLDMEPGKTYLLRVINAALFSEYYLRIAGHKFTVVAGDANYLNPYSTDILAVSPGETVDALVVADAPPGRSYYMVAKPILTPPPDPQIPAFATRATVRYKYDSSNRSNGAAAALSSRRRRRRPEGDAPVVPEMPDEYDMTTSFYFHGNLTGLRRRHEDSQWVPAQVDERMFVTLGLGSVCRRRGRQSCRRGDSDETISVATMNNVSFELPATLKTSMLDAYYRNTSSMNDMVTTELPDEPPRTFNFTDTALMPSGPEEEKLEPTSRATVVRRFRHGAVVEVVFQSTAMWQGDSNPMHLHGHDMLVLAQGLGNYDAARDVARYNLVDPPVRNTVLVPRLGWAAVRFIADNPGMWFLHCHYDFHLSMGMAAVFIVEDGTTADTSLRPPPAVSSCSHDNVLMPQELFLKAK